MMYFKVQLNTGTGFQKDAVDAAVLADLDRD